MLLLLFLSKGYERREFFFLSTTKRRAVEHARFLW